MRLMHLKQENGERVDGWIKARSVSQASYKDYMTANLRELSDNELVLDCESMLKASQVRKELIKREMYYSEWDTSSRGRHFHLFINGLDKIDCEKRILYRSKVITQFGTDQSKKNGFIAMEHKPHFKTGKYKTLVKDNYGINKIDEKVLIEVNQEIVPKRRKLKNSSNLSTVKGKYKITEVWKRWGMTKKGNNWDTPFGTSVNKQCVSINDRKGVWYDFNTGQGGDIITAIELKHNCGFLEALDRLEGGRL